MKRTLLLFLACLLVATWGVMPTRAALYLTADSTELHETGGAQQDPPTVQFAKAAAVVAEDEGRAVIPVTLSASPSHDVEVTVSVRGGTTSVEETIAANAQSTTLTFRTDASPVQQIVLPLSEDREVEGIAYLDLTVQSNDVPLGTPRTFRLWIRDAAPYSALRANVLIEQLQDDFEPVTMLKADQAADTLLSVVWNAAGFVRGVFTGAQAAVPTKNNPRSVAREQGVRVANVWPAPLDDDAAHRDLHLLMPFQADVRTARQKEEEPFASAGAEEEAPNEGAPYLRPREQMKGDVARALLYFYTLYSDQADMEAFERLKPTLAQWMDDDPVDDDELRRNTLVARYQGKANPFVIVPELAERAFNLRGTYPTPTVSFARQRASVSEADSAAVIEVTVTGMGNDDVTFDLLLDEASSTVAADDLSGFRRRTVTFPAGAEDGTVQRIRVPLARDEASEETERATFVLENLSGFARAGEVPRYSLDIEDAELPSQEGNGRVTLGPAYPNPLGPGDGPTVRFDLAMDEAVPITVEVFSTLGQRVHSRSYSAGEAERMDAVEVDGEDLPSGLYIVRLRGPSFSTTETFVVVR